MKSRTRVLVVLIAIAALVQILLLVWKHFSGFDPIQGIADFIVTFLVGTTGSVIIGAGILAIDVRFIHWLDKQFPWQFNVWQRPVIEVALTLITGVGIGVGFTLVYDLLFSYGQPLPQVLLYNIVITVVVNALIVTGTEAVFFYLRNQQSALQAEQLKRENLRMRFETLKKQLAPHFLFNSLNTLSSLVRIDPDKANDFIDEFSSIYRYALDVIEKPAVTIQQELEFARSYLYLQSIRFAEAFQASVDVDESYFRRYVPPLAVQSLLENAFKHNSVSRDHPLEIAILASEDGIIVKNTLQLKARENSRDGVGFENLKSRYRLVSDVLPEVTVTEKEYRVTLPYIEVE